ncbi:MAG TPA: 16S rRNA (adenine(1518)-N(6)/adenine(1519)-N(6))-dimethyltransferase RsmA, partial [Rectinemataceae bacterium]|nr:16S rRNA (adenine(1518)-N(6)/adenine(1519)-N(6))-dimethyltransferase RsmA [Rectinemataceae bacterium]
TSIHRKAMNIAYDSPSSIKTFLEAEGLAMSKRFGQNFLIDRNARERLYASLGTTGPATIWEIGPGIGAMTDILLEKGNRVTAFEIDYGFVRVLQSLFGENPSFSLVEGDFLKTWKSRAGADLSPAPAMPDVIFGNLPYNAALGIIADLLENAWVPAKMVFTVQKEAARRIVAVPGTKDYAAFSVLCSSVCKTKILYDIGATSFWPQPRVTSSVVVLTPRPDPVAGGDRMGFSRFVRSSFSSRRKTLRNNLNALDRALAEHLDETLAKMGLPSDVRAEALTPEQLSSVYFSLPKAAV